MQFDDDMDSPHKDLFVSARQLLLSFDGLQETKKDRITTYSTHNGGVCHLRTMPHGIDIGFLKGARMMDETGSLTGTGKVMRILSLEKMDEDLVRYYITQAIDINAQK